MKRIFSILLSAVLILCVFTGCNIVSFGSKDIVILFTSDVHNESKAGVGYSGVAYYKHELLKDHDYVTLADLGNSLSGGVFDMSAKGMYAAKLMNEAGYDYYNIGGGDFSLKNEDLTSALSEMNSIKLSSNLDYSGNEAPFVPYNVMNYGKTSVGFVGVTAPGVNTGEFETSQDELWSKVQLAVDKVKSIGASYVVVLSNLSDTGDFTAASLAENVSDITAVLCAKSSVSENVVKGKRGNDVAIGTCGEKLGAIGVLTISESGSVSVSESTTEGKIEEIDLLAEKLEKEYTSALTEPVAKLDYSLSIADESGIMKVKTRETTAGNLIADSYVVGAGTSDIPVNAALVSADSIASEIPSGEITMQNILQILPETDDVAVVSVTGRQIADCLEFAVSETSGYFAMNGVAYGEFDGFLQVSGLTFTVDTDTESSVVKSADGVFESVSDARRVQNIKITNNGGQYEDLDLEKTYNIAAESRFIKGETNGNTTLSSGTIVNENAGANYQLLADYMKVANYSDYYSVSGRITIS